jgi:hypothetical protein
MLPLERYPYGQKSRSQTALLGRVLLWGSGSVLIGSRSQAATQYSSCAPRLNIPNRDHHLIMPPYVLWKRLTWPLRSLFPEAVE